MKKIFVLMLVFIVVFSMLNEGLRAGVVYDVGIKKSCNSVTISWRVSGNTKHTHIHWKSGKCSPVMKGSGYFSQTFNLSAGRYSFKIHAKISRKSHWSETMYFAITGCSSPGNSSLGNYSVNPKIPKYNPISEVKIDKSCDRVTISWHVSENTKHTRIHWKSGKSSPVMRGSGYFSQTFKLSTGKHSFKIQAKIRGISYWSSHSFWFIRWC